MSSAPCRLALTAVVAATTLLGAPAAHAAGADPTASRSARPMTIAVIGDVPYGVEQERSVGLLVDRINHDTHARLVLHVGDIKSGSTTCTDERLTGARVVVHGETLPYVPAADDQPGAGRAVHLGARAGDGLTSRPDAVGAAGTDGAAVRPGAPR